jgi:hypothetical protein
MSLPKFNRKMMQTLKDEMDCQHKRSRIDQIVKAIYFQAVSQAKTSKETIFKYEIIKQSFGPQVRDPEYDFIMDNIDLIIYSLNVAFPECSVQLKKYTYMNDGNPVDVSSISDVTTRVFKCKYFIVIDWS